MAVLSLCLLAVSAGAQTWTFDADQQGWTARDLTNYSEAGVVSELNWVSDGTGGYVAKTDPSMNTFVFAAPIAAGTNYSSYVGGQLTFALRSDFSDWTADNVVAFRGISEGNTTTIVAPIAVPGADWANYTLELTSSNFRVGNQSGALVSDTLFSSIMGNLSTFLISGEYGNGVKETTSLDRVSFVAIPEPATTAAMLGAAALLVVGVARYRRKR